MAWSPDPAFDDLVAAGLSSGKVELMRLEGTKSALARPSPSPSPSPGQSSTFSSSWSRPTVSLSVKNSRACNALAFCTADPNYLAVGLDKVRGDFSLVVWDIVSATPSLQVRQPPPPVMTNHNRSTSGAQLAFSVPGTRPEPIIPRGDVASKVDMKILQQHAPTEIVSSVAFLPKSTTLLLAGISHRWLRLFDLRTPTPVVLSAASKVQGIATDPFEPFRIGTFGDGAATIWDARRMTHPLLTFTAKDASADGAGAGARARTHPSGFAHMEFSSVRRGVLATLERDATHVRFWEMQQFDLVDRSPERERSHSRDSTQSYGRTARLSWANPTNILQWSASSAGGSSPVLTTPVEGSSRAMNQVVLSGTRRSE